MPPSTCVLPRAIVSEFPHWNTSEIINFLFYVSTSYCWFHLPCHILQSVDICISAVLAPWSDYVEVSVSVNMFLLREGFWNQQIPTNDDAIQQPDLTLRVRKGTCYLIGISLSSNNVVTEVTDERGCSKYWNTKNDWSTTQVECESEDNDAVVGLSGSMSGSLQM